MNSLWSSRAAGDGDTANEPAKNPIDAANTEIADLGPSLTRSDSNPLPTRPSLQRNQLPPNPPSQPPPPAPTHQSTDSLSLAQIRRIVSEFPKAETAAYDFEYKDAASHPEELDEWFTYQSSQFVRLNNAQRAYESQWEHDLAAKEDEVTWDEASQAVKDAFIQQALGGIKSSDGALRVTSSSKLVYLVLGRWAETAGSHSGDISKLRSLATKTQLAAIKSGVKSVAALGGINIVWEALQLAFDAAFADDPPKSMAHSKQEAQDDLHNLMTLMYMFMQVTLGDAEGMESARAELVSLSPSLPVALFEVTAKFRFFDPREDSIIVPSTQTLLMLWKAIILVFGGTPEIENLKGALGTHTDSNDKSKITASPLDYHAFRQEITSKYPAYVPPQSKIPLDADNISLLPPLPNHPSRNNGSNGILPLPPGTQSSGASILHQPVHIATPAPSPPPSPAIGGKGGKKQNYQTNQNFPFMYPPLDETSNSAGGKGSAGMQEALVGRKWEGSSVPASILEAGKLFSERVRMTRATRQLWDERQKFQKFERGWERSDEEESDELDELDLDALGDDDEHVDTDKLLAFIEQRHKKKEPKKLKDEDGIPSNLPGEMKRRLDAVETFYKSSLPQLQSLVIVLMKGVLASVTASISNTAFNPPGGPGPSNTREYSRSVWNRSIDTQPGVNGSAHPDFAAHPTDADLAGRSLEIESKAATGILLLLLKWLKISHVLKFEYLTQLLLDSNYLPLVLKLFAHQDIQQVVDSKADHIEHSFFKFCNQRAHPSDKLLVEPTEIDMGDDESEDEAVPPPIKRRPSPPKAEDIQDESEGSQRPEEQGPLARPEVDELGYPVNPLPKEPITDFSWRNLFALINYLRIMQKICKHKAHRNLLLVQYKSSNIIRKSLKIPQNELRLYTLKLFKNQVPYCGRKWRQSNMRVITAVYLHCRPELRDEWLAGSDVDAEVEEALPLEQALRSLTHWFNVRRYPDQMAPEIRAVLRDQQDFFKRELEKTEIWNEGNVTQEEWDGQLMGQAWG
ncbi:N1221-domain-containing protein [Xylariaceae sp. FL1272]|nr:N1221-domain-containing protein [Xylariaceae sp. FL1272]